MNIRAMALVCTLVLVALSACSTPGEEQTSSSMAAPATVASTAPEGSTSPTASLSTNPPSTSSPAMDDTRFCDEEGCDSALTIELTDVDITADATYDVEICVNGDCAREVITIDIPDPGTGVVIRGESERNSGTTRAGSVFMWTDGDYVEYFLPHRDYGASALVTFTLKDVSGTVLAKTKDAMETPLERIEPNGPECPPICFFGRITL